MQLKLWHRSMTTLAQFFKLSRPQRHWKRIGYLPKLELFNSNIKFQDREQVAD